MKIRADMGKNPGPLWPLEYIVDKVVEIPNTLFAAFMDHPLERYEFIAQNDVVPYHGDGITHCLLVLNEGCADGVLIQCDGYGSARLMSYLPGARDTVQSKLDQVADHIVRQGTERTAQGGDWCVEFEDLAESLGLPINNGNGLDTMLRETLERRAEVDEATVFDGYIETWFRPNVNTQLQTSAAGETPDIRVRDILPLLTGGGLAFLTHEDAETSVLAENLRELTAAGREDYADLLNARVAEISPSSEGVEIVLTDVAPEELERFNEDYDSFQRAEQAMGDMTP